MTLQRPSADGDLATLDNNRKIRPIGIRRSRKQQNYKIYRHFWPTLNANLQGRRPQAGCWAPVRMCYWLTEKNREPIVNTSYCNAIDPASMALATESLDLSKVRFPAMSALKAAAGQHPRGKSNIANLRRSLAPQNPYHNKRLSIVDNGFKALEISSRIGLITLLAATLLR